MVALWSETHGFCGVKEGVCIIFLSNIRTGALNVLNNGLCEIYFNGKTKVPDIKSIDQLAQSAPALRKFTGVYELFPGFTLTVKEEKGALYLKGTGGYFTSLNCLGPHRFFYRSLFAEIEFETSTDQPGLIWKDALSGATYPAKKIS